MTPAGGKNAMSCDGLGHWYKASPGAEAFPAGVDMVFHINEFQANNWLLKLGAATIKAMDFEILSVKLAGATKEILVTQTQELKCVL